MTGIIYAKFIIKFQLKILILKINKIFEPYFYVKKREEEDCKI